MPLNTLRLSESYWVRTYFSGAQANDVVMSRKSLKLKTGSEELYKATDFYSRFSKTIARGLKDHKYAAQFTLDAGKHYTDDANVEKFEIATHNNE